MWLFSMTCTATSKRTYGYLKNVTVSNWLRYLSSTYTFPHCSCSLECKSVHRKGLLQRTRERRRHHSKTWTRKTVDIVDLVSPMYCLFWNAGRINMLLALLLIIIIIIVIGACVSHKKRTHTYIRRKAHSKHRCKHTRRLYHHNSRWYRGIRKLQMYTPLHTATLQLSRRTKASLYSASVCWCYCSCCSCPWYSDTVMDTECGGAREVTTTESDKRASEDLRKKSLTGHGCYFKELHSEKQACQKSWFHQFIPSCARRVSEENTQVVTENRATILWMTWVRKDWAVRELPNCRNFAASFLFSFVPCCCFFDTRTQKTNPHANHLPQPLQFLLLWIQDVLLRHHLLQTDKLLHCLTPHMQ